MRIWKEKPLRRIVQEEVHDSLFRHRDRWEKFEAGVFVGNMILEELSLEGGLVI
jgi:hypothetical protein